MVQLYDGGGVLGGGGAARCGNGLLPDGGGIIPLPTNGDGIPPFPKGGGDIGCDIVVGVVGILSWKPEAKPASKGPKGGWEGVKEPFANTLSPLWRLPF